MGEIVEVFPIFPASHALVVVLAIVSVADAMWIANKEGSNPLFDAKVDDSPGGFMMLVTHTSCRTLADFVPGPLQPLPAKGILLAARLLLRNLPKLLIALALEGADPATGDNEGLPCIGGEGGQVDFS